jgi:hypothetical protein
MQAQSPGVAPVLLYIVINILYFTVLAQLAATN